MEIAVRITRRTRLLPILLVLMAAGCGDGAPQKAPPSTELVEPVPAPDVAPPAPPNQPTPARPNLLVIVVDSLRPDHLGCYGYARDTSPRIDALAKTSLLFERAWSTSSWTLPAMMSVMTGYDARRHGVMGESLRLAEGARTLASHLKANQYATVGIVSSPVVGRQFGFDSGFDHYDDRSYKKSFLDKKMPRRTIGASPPVRRMASSPLITEIASDWIRKLSRGDKPWLLFVHYMDPHWEYVPRAPHDTRYDPDYRGPVNGQGVEKYAENYPGATDADLKHLVALYDGEIRQNDEQIGVLFDVLKEVRVDDRTVIVFTSDHGEAFLEHNHTGHGNTLHEEEVRVPLIVHVPGGNPGRSRAAASLVDVFPTACSALELPVPEDLDGLDLRADISPSRSVNLDLHYGVGLTASVQADLKSVLNLEDRVVDLYDLKADPDERAPQRVRIQLSRTEGQALKDAKVVVRDSPREFSPLAKRFTKQGALRRMWDYRTAQMEKERAAKSNLTEEEIRMFEGLGYVR